MTVSNISRLYATLLGPLCGPFGASHDGVHREDSLFPPGCASRADLSVDLVGTDGPNRLPEPRPSAVRSPRATLSHSGSVRANDSRRSKPAPWIRWQASCTMGVTKEWFTRILIGLGTTTVF
jgi:hypothetical protein